ncbi:MAG: NADH-quinone oxidoreductase subunit L [Chloroflexi bacterium]|nr:NADH-quinone oxidoreductase subunit L [Chloroflexota bacterium]
MIADFLNDPNFLPWLIPVGPLLGFLIIVLATNRSRWVPATDRHEYGGHHPDYNGMSVPVVAPASRVLSIVVGMSGSIAAFLIALAVVLRVSQVDFVFGEQIFGSAVEWLSVGIANFNMGVMVDPLTTIMLVMVPIAVLCIFIYSIGYMAHDPRQARFFALISLFAGAMLTLVVADNLLLLFVGWEIMGLCSYLLIGFWFEKESAYKAAIKAFTTTRVADVIMLLGIAYLYSVTGTLSFREILYNTEVLETLANTPAILIGGMSAAGLIGVFLIIGTIGKSAQFPLHVWLPDAMEGPTPVSAMIHAAAMVSAGVYAILRMYPLLEAGGHPHAGEFNSPLLLMAIVGGFTALFSATIAVAQNDVKKVLAYSTISQLGFMMAALGIGAFIAAAFHLITHAFFKALLFMASGSVIHAMEHGEHHVHEHAHGHHDDEDEDEHAHGHAAEAHHDDHAEHHEEHHDEAHSAPHFDPQDMMNMGGLAKRIPVTFYTFVIGGLSLAGFPLLTAGFWSKDEILADAWLGTTEGFGPHAFVFLMLATAAFLTAFYTARQLCLTFLGEPRTEEAKHAGLGGPSNVVSITMQLPLIILAVFAIIAGFVGVPPDFPIFGAIFSPEHNNFKYFVNETLPPAIQADAPAFNWFPVAVSFLVALGGLGLGYLMYGRKPLKAGEEDPLIKMLGPVHNVLKNKYFFDELYETIFIKPSQAVARAVSEFVDRGIIDGTLHTIGFVFRWIGDLLKMLNLWLIDGFGDGIPRLIGWTGLQVRRIQTGRVQQYLLLVAAAAVIIGLIFVVSAGTAAN